MAVAVVGLPAGMKVPTDLKQLTDLREKGAIDFFEVRGRELVLYWRELAPEQKSTLTVDLVCDVPGEYRGPASRGYLYYNADHKHWVEPLVDQDHSHGPQGRGGCPEVTRTCGRERGPRTTSGAATFLTARVHHKGTKFTQRHKAESELCVFV